MMGPSYHVLVSEFRMSKSIFCSCRLSCDKEFGCGNENLEVSVAITKKSLGQSNVNPNILVAAIHFWFGLETKLRPLKVIVHSPHLAPTEIPGRHPDLVRPTGPGRTQMAWH